jgi:uncharacterized protein (DUF1499 family)
VPDAPAADTSASPLPPCPDSPNCVRTARAFAADADTLLMAAQRALAAMGPVELTLEPEAARLHAVFRVALVFKDDVSVAVTTDDGGGGGAAPDRATLHVRSASRLGYSDLGVNRRRVDRFFERLAAELSR